MVEHVWLFGEKEKQQQNPKKSIFVRKNLYFCKACVGKVVMESHLANAMHCQVVHLPARSLC